MFDTHTHTHTIHSARCFVCVYWCQTPHAVIITISAEHVLEIPIVVGLDFWIHSPVGRSSPFECTTTESSTVRMSWRRWCVLVLQTVGTIYDGIIMAWNWNDFQSTSTNRLWPTVNLFICMFSVFFFFSCLVFFPYRQTWMLLLKLPKEKKRTKRVDFHYAMGIPSSRSPNPSLLRSVNFIPVNT